MVLADDVYLIARAIDGHRLAVAHHPCARHAARMTRRDDGSPVVIREVVLQEAHRHRAGLVRRCGVVRSRRHADGDRRAAVGLARHRHRVARYAHRRRRCVVAHGADRAVAAARHRDGLTLRRGVQCHAGGGDGEAARRLPDTPAHALRRGASVAPSVVALRREGRCVAPCVGARGRAADGQLCRVVVVPCGGLAAAVVGQAPALARHRGDRLPVHRHAGGGRLGHVPLRVAHRDRLRAHGIKRRWAAAVARHIGGRSVRVGGLHHHARALEAVAILIDLLRRLRRDLDLRQPVDDRDGLLRRLRHAALCVADGHLRCAVRQRCIRLVAVARAFQRRAVAVGCCHHHARRVKGLALRVGGLRWCLRDGDAGQLDAAASAAHHVEYQTHAVASVLRMFTVRLAVGASLQWKVIFPAVVTSSA